MKRKSKSIILGLVLGGFFFALNPITACADRPPPPAECRILPQDPFEPEGRLGSGAHEGECIDTANYRSYRALTATDVTRFPRLAALDLEKLQLIANVQHLGKFWVAAIPKRDRVARIIFQAEHFPPEWVAAHTQMRIDFRAGQEPLLFLQTDLAAAPVKMNSLILSNEAIPIRGGPSFNLYTGVLEYFGFGRRLVSLPDMVEKIRQVKHWTEQYELRFKDEDRREAYFDFALGFFADPEMKHMYHTIYANCSNSLYESYDAFAGRPRGTWDRTQTTLPLTFRWALKKRGMIDDNSELISLNKEFNVLF